MEEKKNDKEYCVGPVCFHCGGLHGGKHILLRWAIGFAIIALTFWLGMKIGEFKSFIGNYGYGMHGGYYHSATPGFSGCYGNDTESPLQNRFWMMQ